MINYLNYCFVSKQAVGGKRIPQNPDAVRKENNPKLLQDELPPICDRKEAIYDTFL